jgi:hypothetical protein
MKILTGKPWSSRSRFVLCTGNTFEQKLLIFICSSTLQMDRKYVQNVGNIAYINTAQRHKNRIYNEPQRETKIAIKIT